MTALSVARVVLAFGTAVAVPLLVLAATGRGSITLHARLDPPYSVGFEDGRTIEVGPEVTAKVDFPQGEEDALGDRPAVTVEAPVDSEDTDTRVVVITAVAVVLALAWTTLVNLRRIVASATEGEPFDGRNVRRLQAIASVLLVAPVLAYAGTRLLNATFDQSSIMTVEVSSPGWWVFVLGGLGALALAEVFRMGSDLRELERHTV